jgi:hypothetical protein
MGSDDKKAFLWRQSPVTLLGDGVLMAEMGHSGDISAMKDSCMISDIRILSQISHM